MKLNPIIVTLAFAAAAHAQAPDAPKPVVKVGEVAVYAVRLGSQATEDTVAVTSVDAGQITTRFSRANRTPPESEAIYTEEWNPVLVGSSGTRFEPASRTLQFPLEVGKGWESKALASTPTGAKSRFEMTGKVVGSEKLKTPAGEFDTYKVENTGWVNGVSWNGSFKVVQTAWYAPAINRMVRFDYKEHRRDGLDTTSELKSFTPAP